MPPLTSDQLDSIQRLLSDPLRQAVRTEMQAGHDRLAAAIERVSEQLGNHIAENVRRERARDTRLESLEHRVVMLEGFRAKVLIVYAALTFALSFAWSIFRDWIAGNAKKN
jgi:hypothetical protein